MVPVREIFINLGICGKKKGQYVSTRKNWYLYPPKNDVAILLVEQAEDVIVPYKIFSLVKEYMKFDGNSAVWLPLSKFDIDLTNKHQWIKQEIFQERRKHFLDYRDNEERKYNENHGAKWAYENKDAWIENNTNRYNPGPDEIELGTEITIEELLKLPRINEEGAKLVVRKPVLQKKRMFLEIPTTKQVVVGPKEGKWEEVVRDWKYFLLVREFYGL